MAQPSAAGYPAQDGSIVGRWWVSIDRWLLAALLLLVGIGILLLVAASPSVAERINLDSWHFVKRQLTLLPPALLIMFALSLLEPRQIRIVAAAGFALFFVLMLFTLVAPNEIKGAKRWVSLPGFSLQPSELVKPFFAVLTAWLLAHGRERADFPGQNAAIGMLACVVLVLSQQPDVGMASLVSVAWFVQLFLAGLSLWRVILIVVTGLSCMVLAYFSFSHVAIRVDRFLNPGTGETYQVDKSLEAFSAGGFLGRGPGEGVVKQYIPDAHADFIFAVAGEEMGLVACLIITGLFGFIVIRGFSRVLQDSNLFVVLAASGLLVQFGMQAFINMASTLNLIPTKGMTLPFISYGGSSLLGVAVTTGLLLALTRNRRPQAGRTGTAWRANAGISGLKNPSSPRMHRHQG